jgi:hypothetical protein
MFGIQVLSVFLKRISGVLIGAVCQDVGVSGELIGTACI